MDVLSVPHPDQLVRFLNTSPETLLDSSRDQSPLLGRSHHQVYPALDLLRLLDEGVAVASFKAEVGPGLGDLPALFELEGGWRTRRPPHLDDRLVVISCHPAAPIAGRTPDGGSDDLLFLRQKAAEPSPDGDGDEVMGGVLPGDGDLHLWILQILVGGDLSSDGVGDEVLQGLVGLLPPTPEEVGAADGADGHLDCLWGLEEEGILQTAPVAEAQG